MGQFRGMNLKRASKYGTIAAFLIALAWFLFTQLDIRTIFLAIDSTTISNLLAITSQILVTVLAIVFSVALLAAEVASRFSSRIIDQVFRRSTFAYMIVFIATVLFSFVLLTTKKSFPAHMYKALGGIALVLTSACLLYLIWFFHSTKEWLKMETLCEDLKARGESAIQKAKKVDEVKEVQTLCELALNLKAGKSYEDLSSSIEALRKLVIFATKEGKGGIAIGIVHKLGDIGTSMLDDVESARRIVAKLGRCITTETNTTLVEQKVKERLTEIVKEVINKEGLVARRVIYELGGLGGYFVKSRIVGARWIIRNLHEYNKICLGKRNDLLLPINRAIHWIGQIALGESETGIDLKVYRQAINSLYSNFVTDISNKAFSEASHASWHIQDLGKKATDKGFDEGCAHAFHVIGNVTLKYLELHQELLLDKNAPSDELKSSYEGFDGCMKALRKAGNEVTRKKLKEATKSINTSLSNIASYSGPVGDVGLLGKAVSHLRIIALEAIRNELYDEALMGIDHLVQVGQKVPHVEVRIDCLHHLGRLYGEIGLPDNLYLQIKDRAKTLKGNMTSSEIKSALLSAINYVQDKQKIEDLLKDP